MGPGLRRETAAETPQTGTDATSTTAMGTKGTKFDVDGPRQSATGTTATTGAMGTIFGSRQSTTGFDAGRSRQSKPSTIATTGAIAMGDVGGSRPKFDDG